MAIAEENLALAGTAKNVAVVELQSAYWQILVAEKAVKKTACVTRDFFFNRMPFTYHERAFGVAYTMSRTFSPLGNLNG